MQLNRNGIPVLNIVPRKRPVMPTRPMPLGSQKHPSRAPTQAEKAEAEEIARMRAAQRVQEAARLEARRRHQAREAFIAWAKTFPPGPNNPLTKIRTEIRRQRSLIAAGGDVSRVDCFYRGKEKRCFADWLDAIVACYRLRLDQGPTNTKFPYRCRYGHIHIGQLPDPRKFLTGGCGE